MYYCVVPINNLKLLVVSVNNATQPKTKDSHSLWYQQPDNSVALENNYFHFTLEDLDVSVFLVLYSSWRF